MPLFLAARADAKTKRLVYCGMLAREGFLAAVLLGQIAGQVFGSGSGKGGEEEGTERVLEEGRVADRSCVCGRAKSQLKQARVDQYRLKRILWMEVCFVMRAQCVYLGKMPRRRGFGGYPTKLYID